MRNMRFCWKGEDGRDKDCFAVSFCHCQTQTACSSLSASCRLNLYHMRLWLLGGVCPDGGWLAKRMSASCLPPGSASVLVLCAVSVSSYGVIGSQQRKELCYLARLRGYCYKNVGRHKQVSGSNGAGGGDGNAAAAPGSGAPLMIRFLFARMICFFTTTYTVATWTAGTAAAVAAMTTVSRCVWAQFS